MKWGGKLLFGGVHATHSGATCRCMRQIVKLEALKGSQGSKEDNWYWSWASHGPHRGGRLICMKNEHRRRSPKTRDVTFQDRI